MKTSLDNPTAACESFQSSFTRLDPMRAAAKVIDLVLFISAEIGKWVKISPSTKSGSLLLLSAGFQTPRTRSTDSDFIFEQSDIDENDTAPPLN